MGIFPQSKDVQARCIGNCLQAWVWMVVCLNVLTQWKSGDLSRVSHRISRCRWMDYPSVTLQWIIYKPLMIKSSVITCRLPVCEILPCSSDVDFSPNVHVVISLYQAELMSQSLCNPQHHHLQGWIERKCVLLCLWVNCAFNHNYSKC